MLKRSGKLWITRRVTHQLINNLTNTKTLITEIQKGKYLVYNLVKNLNFNKEYNMAKHLTQAQRYYICIEIARSCAIISQTAIAKALGVHKATVSREIARNSKDNGSYNVDYAHKQASLRRSYASSAKAFKKLSKRMKQYIATKLQEKWSPEQISGRMPIDIGKSISHETIYQYIKSDKRNDGKLFRLLARRGKKYRYGASKGSAIVGRIDISERPKIVAAKTRIGDFEIDTVVSARNTGKSCLFTMVDRRSKMTFIRKTLDKSAASIQAAIEDIYLNTIIPIRTLTSDNGTEFANHVSISENIACDFYFARPYRSGDRGLNENTNGLIRRELPKGTNFDTISVEEIRQIENSLNNRPRKALKYKTPNEVTDKYLQRISRNHPPLKNVGVAIHA